MERERGSFPVQLMCRVLAVSRSGYYKWRRVEVPTLRDCKRAETLAEIRAVFEASRQTYGSPRVQRELQSRGRAHSRRYIGKLMKEASLRARASQTWATRRESCQPSPEPDTRRIQFDLPANAPTSDTERGALPTGTRCWQPPAVPPAQLEWHVVRPLPHPPDRRPMRPGPRLPVPAPSRDDPPSSR